MPLNQTTYEKFTLSFTNSFIFPSSFSRRENGKKEILFLSGKREVEAITRAEERARETRDSFLTTVWFPQPITGVSSTHHWCN